MPLTTVAVYGVSANAVRSRRNRTTRAGSSEVHSLYRSVRYASSTCPSTTSRSDQRGQHQLEPVSATRSRTESDRSTTSVVFGNPKSREAASSERCVSRRATTFGDPSSVLCSRTNRQTLERPGSSSGSSSRTIRSAILSGICQVAAGGGLVVVVVVADTPVVVGAVVVGWIVVMVTAAVAVGAVVGDKIGSVTAVSDPSAQADATTRMTSAPTNNRIDEVFQIRPH